MKMGQHYSQLKYHMANSHIVDVIYWQWKKKILDGNQSYLWCSLLAMREEYIGWQSVITIMFFIGNERRIYQVAISHNFYVLYWPWEKKISNGNQSYLWCSLLPMREEYIGWQTVISLMFFISNERRNRQWVISLLLFSGN